MTSAKTMEGAVSAQQLAASGAPARGAGERPYRDALRCLREELGIAAERVEIERILGIPADEIVSLAREISRDKPRVIFHFGYRGLGERFETPNPGDAVEIEDDPEGLVAAVHHAEDVGHHVAGVALAREEALGEELGHMPIQHGREGTIGTIQLP